MKNIHKETPKQRISPRGKLIPIEILCEDATGEFLILWYHKGNFYEDLPHRVSGHLTSDEIQIEYWDYLPKSHVATQEES